MFPDVRERRLRGDCIGPRYRGLRTNSQNRALASAPCRANPIQFRSARRREPRRSSGGLRQIESRQKKLIPSWVRRPTQRHAWAVPRKPVSEGIVRVTKMVRARELRKNAPYPFLTRVKKALLCRMPAIACSFRACWVAHVGPNPCVRNDAARRTDFSRRGL